MLLENTIISHVLVTLDHYKDLSRLKAAVADGEYSPVLAPHFSRTLVYKTCLITNSLNIQAWGPALSSSRAVYHELKKRDDMAVPWFSLDPSAPFYCSETSQTQKDHTHTNKQSARSGRVNLVKIGNVEDRLLSSPSPSRHTLEPYTISELDVELLRSIILDIDRLFPDEHYFHSSCATLHDSKKLIIEVLYVWCKCNPLVGYKQGLHEIIGLFGMSLEREAMPLPAGSTYSNDDLRILGLYDSEYLAHDLFAIFNRFMVQSGVVALFYESEDLLWGSIERFNIYLMKVDQLIHYNLVSKLKLESQLWIIRYLRLLLSREMDSDLDLVALLWDKLVVLDHGEHGLVAIPDIIMFMTIQLLIQVKPDLVTCDFSDCLSLLLHYPMTIRLKAHSSPLLMINHLYRDAIRLYASRHDDMKLYEAGIKLNSRYNPSLKVKMTFAGKSETGTNPSPPLAQVSNKEKMRYEKIRMEMLLKKKMQLMIKP